MKFKEVELKELLEITNILNSEGITLRKFLENINKTNNWSKFNCLKSIELAYGENSGSTLNKKLNKYGFYFNSEYSLWYNKNNHIQLEIIDDFKAWDIEEEIESIANMRYYNSFKNGFFDDEDKELVDISIDKNLYDEYVKISEEKNCDLEDEYMILVLLKHLEEIKPLDNTISFKLRDLKEECGEEEYQFVIKHMKEGYDLDKLVTYAYGCYEAERDVDIEEFKLEQQKRACGKSRI